MLKASFLHGHTAGKDFVEQGAGTDQLNNVIGLQNVSTTSRQLKLDSEHCGRMADVLQKFKAATQKEEGVYLVV